MKRKIFRNLLLSASLLALVGVMLAGIPGAVEARRPEAPAAQGNTGPAFSYQGYLEDNENPVNATCRFTFSLFDRVQGGNQIGSTQTIIGVSVVEGAFAVVLNEGNQFGDSAFNGQARWLEIAVDCGRGVTTLSPRHELLAVPYAHSLRPGAVIRGATPAQAILNLQQTSATDQGLRVQTVNGFAGYFQSEQNQIAIVDSNSTPPNTTWLLSSLGNDGGFGIRRSGVPFSMQFAPNGNVGIGVVTPLGALNSPLTVGGTQDQITIFHPSSPVNWRLESTLPVAGDTQANFRISHGDLSRLSITHDGNVGIGTESPTARLHVFGDIRGNSIFARDTDHQIAIIDVDNGKTWTLSTLDSQGGVGVYEDGQSSRLFIAAGGDVGIGTALPSARLSVNGDIQARSLTDSEPDLILGGSGPGGIADDGLISSQTTLVSSDIILSSNDTVRIDLNADGVPANENSDFEIWGNNNLVFNVDSGGNVGIGTTNPTARLSVNGNIRAKEITVETGWSDFVFEENYELMSLAEVETYIEEHGHLPDIPSVAEVAANGVRVGEIESRLLQKIEELTLHLIAMDKRMQELEQENAQLNGTLETLEAIPPATKGE